MKKQNRFISWIKNPSSDIWLFIIALILLNLVASHSFLRLDLTSPKSYSLSKSSKQAVRTLEEPLSVKVFFSSNLPSPYSSVEQYVKDMLSEYKNAAGKNFSCEFFDMNNYDNQRIARGYGLNMMQIQEVKNNEVGLKNVYMGIVLCYADQIEKIDGISSADGFEYKLTSAIGKIVSDTNILSGLEDSVYLCLYKSESLSSFGISGFDRIDEEVDSAFNSLNGKFHGRLVLKKENPSSSEAESLGQKYGIQTVQWKNGDAVNYGAIGLVVEFGSKFRVVPLELSNMIFSYAVSGLEDLEENIEESVKSVLSQTSTIAYVSGHRERDLYEKEGAQALEALLSDSYSLEEVDLSESDIPFSAQSLIVNGPREKFLDSELYKIDQFVLRGGNALFFVDSHEEFLPQGEMVYYQQPVYIPLKTGVEKLFEKYGVSVGKEYVLDEESFTQNNRQYGKLNFYYIPRLQKSSLDQKKIITKNLGDVFVPKVSEIDISDAIEKEDVKVSVLAHTSEKSWTVPVEGDFVLSPIAFVPPKDNERFSVRNIAVLLEGKFESAFASPPSNDEDSDSGDFKSNGNNLKTENHLERSAQNSKVLVVSTSEITGPILQNANEPVSIFVRNAVDYMNGKDDFCLMRTKNLSVNTLRFSSGKFALFAKYFCEVGLSVLVVLLGLLALIVRKRHREKIRLMYDADDSRFIKS